MTAILALGAFCMVLSPPGLLHCISEPSAGFNQVASLLKNQCFERSMGRDSSDARTHSLEAEFPLGATSYKNKVA